MSISCKAAIENENDRYIPKKVWLNNENIFLRYTNMKKGVVIIELVQKQASINFRNRPNCLLQWKFNHWEDFAFFFYAFLWIVFIVALKMLATQMVLSFRKQVIITGSEVWAVWEGNVPPMLVLLSGNFG